MIDWKLKRISLREDADYCAGYGSANLVHLQKLT